MRPFFVLFFALLASTASVSAQDLALATVSTPPVTAPPSLAYRAPETTEARTFRAPKRERTLLGDLNLTGAWGGPTYNYTATGNDWSLLRGGFGGLEFSEELFIGYGGWKSREQLTVDDPVDNSPEFDFKHGGLIIAYSPFADNAIHPRITTLFGPARFELDKDFEPTTTEGRDDRFLVGQAMIGLELNLFQWFRLGIDGGYRFATGVDNEFVTAQDISGAIVQVEARFGFSW